MEESTSETQRWKSLNVVSSFPVISDGKWQAQGNGLNLIGTLCLGAKKIAVFPLTCWKEMVDR